jgi:16S rRNA (guanine966-N2)-methyltransferase
MRVIAGQWRGRRLQAPRGEAIRPTTDRVKEALFNILGPEVTGCLCLDLCCGTGGLGIEALSRGAREAVFVDKDPHSLEATRNNLATCGADPVTWKVVRSDAAGWLSEWKPPEEGTPWILLADPPYRSDLAGAIMEQVGQWSDRPGFLAAVVEMGQDTPGLAAMTWETRRYGESILAILRP